MQYYQLAPEENTFEAIMVDVTHRCNMKCHNCYLPNRKIPDMDTKKLLDVISRLPSKTFIRLIGAEPTLRSDLPELISEIRAMGHRVSVTTNGLKLSDRKYVQDLKNSGLRLILLSMNGADDDDLYEKIDNMRCAEKKLRALYNCVELGMIINTGTIISKGINEQVIAKQIDIFRNIKMKVPPVLRFRTVGLIGRNQGAERAFESEEFLELFCNSLNIDEEYIFSNQIAPQNNVSGISFKFNNVIVRLVDWSVDVNGVPDSGNINRGRITENWKIAPFFEDVKRNEFGY